MTRRVTHTIVVTVDDPVDDGFLNASVWIAQLVTAYFADEDVRGGCKPAQGTEMRVYEAGDRGVAILTSEVVQSRIE